MTTHKLYPSVRVFPTPSHPTAARPLYEVPPFAGRNAYKEVPFAHSFCPFRPSTVRVLDCYFSCILHPVSCWCHTSAHKTYAADHDSHSPLSGKSRPGRPAPSRNARRSVRRPGHQRHGLLVDGQVGVHFLVGALEIPAQPPGHF